jgi:hypothetical protein
MPRLLIDGTTWTKKGEIIKSAKPKDWTDWSGQSVRGVGTPSALIDATNTYIYLYYVEFSGLKNGIQAICLARAPLSKGAPSPGNWEKFYLGDFAEPGLGGPDSLTGWLLYAYTPKYTSNPAIPGVALHLAGRRIDFTKR